MIYAQFFQNGADGKLMEACGDRSVVILDGRISRYGQRQLAIDECKKRGYLAWQLMRGESFTRSVSIGEITKI